MIRCDPRPWRAARERQEDVDLYVSKLGDDSDGSSWQHAFATIQAGLCAVPDDKGAHRVIVWPDTYQEPNIYATHKGASGRYNELVGDFDGSFGSGTTGWVLIDSGDPSRGFKSYDWWSTIRAYAKGWSKEHTGETTSAITWDRWRLRHLYAAGGDAGIMFDGTDHVEPFSVLVEDCVSVGRAFGGGVASVLSRTGEPIVYRRCTLWALDWWGDTAGAYVRVENETMPDRPDIVFEDCTMVGPQCSLKGGNYGFKTFSSAHVKGCRLVTLNFSQPRGTPTDGIVQSVEHGKAFKVSFEDSTLMGYKVFGVKVQKESVGELAYTTEGCCLAYVQFEQEVPRGFHRLGRWPVEAFQWIQPPALPARPSPLGKGELVRLGVCELGPFLWQGRLRHLESIRPAGSGRSEDPYLLIRHRESGSELARLASGYSLASACVHEDSLYVYAARLGGGSWNDVTLFESRDFARWEERIVIHQEDEHLFNSSVCRGPEGFVMAYESDDPRYPPFTVKFATSADLRSWTRLEGAVFGTNRYTACPCIRYTEGFYYMMYLEHRSPGHVFETYIARSKDLRRWGLSSANPMLRASGLDEGINASDPEIIEIDGTTWVYYAVGDQLTWMNIKRAAYPGTMAAFLKEWFRTDGIEDAGTADAPARRGPLPATLRESAVRAPPG